MNRRVWFAVPLMTLPLTLAQDSPRKEGALDRAAELAAIEAHTRLYEEAFNAGDVEKVMSCYGATYYDLNAASPAITHEDRSRRIELVFGLYDVHAEITSDDILLSGDARMAVQRGEIEMRYSPRAGGQEVKRRLRYVEVLERAEDGHWVVVWGLHGEIEG